jgi:excisionase family DNA binding protein
MQFQNLEQPIVISESDKTTLSKLEALLDKSVKENQTSISAKLVGSEGEEVILTDALTQALLSLVDYLGQGQAVSLIPLQNELTIQQTADILDLPRSHITKLLGKGELPFRELGKIRKIKLADVLTYQKKLRLEQKKLLDEITQLSQELGMYDIDNN